MPTTPVVDVAELYVHFGAIAALQNFHAVLHPGETLALVGGSGSGKTTLGRALLRLDERAAVRATRLRVCGVDVLAAKPAELRALRGGRVGYCFQDALATLNPLQRVGDALRETQGAHGANQPLEMLLAQVELTDTKRILSAYPHQLSGGQRQRVGLAVAIAADPDLLIADEPTASLDPPLARTIARLLSQMTRVKRPNRPPRALLLITHDLWLVQAVCATTIVLQHGIIVEKGATERLIAVPRHAMTKTLLTAVGLASAEIAIEDEWVEPQ